MSIQVIVELDVKPDHRNELLALFANLLQQTRARDGNEGVRVLSELDPSTKILLVEQWLSLNDYEKYNHWREQRGDLAMLGIMLNKPASRRYFNFIQV